MFLIDRYRCVVMRAYLRFLKMTIYSSGSEPSMEALAPFTRASSIKYLSSSVRDIQTNHHRPPPPHTSSFFGSSHPVCSANLPLVCFIRTSMHKAAVSAWIFSLPTNGLQSWMYECPDCQRHSKVLAHLLQVRALLVSLRSLLSEPNNESPLNNQAALL
jgi:hypothetical protein